jgi:hypothetical protein
VKNSSKGRGNVRIRQHYPEPNLMSITRNCSGIEPATERDVLYQKLMCDRRNYGSSMGRNEGNIAEVASLISTRCQPISGSQARELI